MKNSSYQLTYGVEIEFVLVFHEKLIFAQLERDAGRPIRCNNELSVAESQIDAYLWKDLPPQMRVQMNTVPQEYHQTRPRYLAWGVRVREDEAVEPTAATYSRDRKIRSYKYEHLDIAREVVRSAAQNENLQYWDTAYTSDTAIDVYLVKPATADNWYLTKELAIEALTQTELGNYLATYKRCFARDGPTSGQGSKRALSQDSSSAGGSAPKKPKLTGDFSIYSSPQTNDSNLENIPPKQSTGTTAQDNVGLSSSFQSNNSNQENMTPQKENKTASKVDALRTSSSSAPSKSSSGLSAAKLDPIDAFTSALLVLTHDKVAAIAASAPLGSEDAAIAASLQELRRSIISPHATPTPMPRPRPNPGTQVSDLNQQMQSPNQQDPDTPTAKFSLVSFYDPKIKARDRKNRSLDEILEWDDTRLEREHDYIQLLFPLPEPSEHNPHAPLVDEATFRAFNTRLDLPNQVLRALDRMLRFFGFRRIIRAYVNNSIVKSDTFSMARKRWDKSASHNHKRITRIIRSLRILGLGDEAFHVHRAFNNQFSATAHVTKSLWFDAVDKPLYYVPGGSIDLRSTHPFLMPNYKIRPIVPATSTAAKSSNLLPSQVPRPGGQPITTSGPSKQQTLATHPIGQPNTSALDLPISFITVTTPDRTTPSEPPNTFNEMIKLPAATVHQRTRCGPEARLPESSEWDSQGAGLVSRGFKLANSEAGFAEINDLCNKLKGRPCHLHGATASPKTGLHVHMKAANADTGLATLQYLLYILAMYEKQINTLLPPHRRTDSTNDTVQNELRSNCINIHTVDRVTPPGTQGYPATELPLDHVRMTIFDNIGNALGGLVYLSGGDEKRVVNFTHLLGGFGKPDGPHTIEFRQHESVLRGQMIKYWVRFCAGLLRVAHHRAHFQPPPASGHTPGAAMGGMPIWSRMTAAQIANYTGTSTPFIRTDRIPNMDSRGFPFAEWDDSMSVFDLIEEMELDDETAKYFHRRAAFFAAQDPSFPTVTPPATQDINPSTLGNLGSVQQPISMGSTQTSGVQSTIGSSPLL
ncbi:hypothetical protein MMC11_000821 [Xylographa trunciseda]|nr:hypothetical protein [Xylographa trunciseda]